MQHLIRQPFNIDPVLARALPQVTLAGPTLAAEALQFFDGALSRANFDPVTGDVVEITDYSTNGQNITPVSGFVPTIDPGARPPRGQAQAVVSMAGDGILYLGADFPDDTSWTKVVAFRPDVAAMTGVVAKIWSSSVGNSNIHRLAIFNGSLLHTVGSAGSFVQLDLPITSVWTYAVASWNDSTKLLRLGLRDTAPISMTGTTQDVINSDHYLGGDSAEATFHGDIGPALLLSGDAYDDTAQMARIHEFFEAAIGRA